MKFRIILLGLVTLFISGHVGAQSAQAKIVFDKVEHDFGSFKEEAGSQSFNFDFVNNGATPLILKEYRWGSSLGSVLLNAL